MSELHRAVQAEVAAHTPTLPPSFEALKARRRSRDRRRAGVAVAASALAVAGIAFVPGLLATPERLSSGVAAEPVADGRNPQTTTIGGLEVRRDGSAAITGAYTDPQDPAALFVYAGRADKPSQCDVFAAVRVVKQDATSVTLDAAAYKPAEPPAPNTGCDAMLRPLQQHRLDLGIPLAGRRVLDSDGRELRVLDIGTLLVPSRLPEGYRQPGKLTVGVGTADAGNDVTLHTYNGPDSRTQLEIYQGIASKVPGRDEPVGPFVVDRPTVRGHSAVVTETPGLQDLTCLRWRERPDFAVMVCSRGYPPPFGSAELQAVAASMGPAGDRQPTPDTAPAASGAPAG